MTTPRVKQFRLNSRGDMITADSNGMGLILPIGQANQVLVSDGTAPGYAYLSDLRSVEGDLILAGSAVGGAVNHLSVLAAVTGDSPRLTAVGDDTNLDIHVEPKGTGEILVPLTYTPTSDFALTHKKYVDQRVEIAAQGLDIKESVRAIALTAVTLSGFQTIDGVTLAEGDRVLVAAQGGSVEVADAANGIYIVHSGAWVRAADFDGNPAGDVSANAYTFVEEGVLYADTGWVLVTNGTITVDTTPLKFTQFSTAGVFLAGDGLSRDGLNFNVNTSGVTTAVVNDTVVVRSTGTAGQVLRSTGTAGAEAAWGALDLANANAITGILPRANGGLGSNVAGFADQSLFIASGSGVAELARGAANTVLRSDGASLSYGYVSSLRNASGVETVAVDATAGTANILTVTTAGTGGNLNLKATGTDTDIGFVLTPKGAGYVLAPVGYSLDAAPSHAFATKGYVDALSGTETHEDELAYGGATVTSGTATLTGFFTHTPMANTIAVFFNGIKLRKTEWSVSGTNLVLNIGTIGYSIESGDVISASYEYI